MLIRFAKLVLMVVVSAIALAMFAQNVVRHLSIRMENAFQDVKWDNS